MTALKYFKQKRDVLVCMNFALITARLRSILQQYKQKYVSITGFCTLGSGRHDALILLMKSVLAELKLKSLLRLRTFSLSDIVPRLVLVIFAHNFLDSLLDNVSDLVGRLLTLIADVKVFREVPVQSFFQSESIF